MGDGGDRQIVPGISMTPSGQATVKPAMANVLFDLAIQLEETMNLPVDVEHVVAAVVLASRNGELDRDERLSPDDPALATVLADHVRKVFEAYEGKLGVDD